jgi:methylamine methyltransferase corrinoid protein reductive activase
MATLGIALDLGTSGFRGQALDLDCDGRVISTAVTSRHPLPGANVIDHVHFALEGGLDCAHEVLMEAVNGVIAHLGIDRNEVARLAVCGNPIQLSLFQEIEIRDLAYAGQHKLEALGVLPPERNAQIVEAHRIRSLDLPAGAEVLIPPAVRHEIGADALAMIVQTGILEKDEIAMTTDYGTNAEMALVAHGNVYSGSTAAGPALEGQQIGDGLLALPGAISDVAVEVKKYETNGVEAGQGRLKTYVLDPDMKAVHGDTVDPFSGELIEKGKMQAAGITGTGVVSLIREGLKEGIICIPGIRGPSKEIRLPNGIRFTERDLVEAGKAIGSVRAGHLTLCVEAGIEPDDIETAYMSGASGTYVDALKAYAIGMVPSGVKRIYQAGNTSLAMARALILNTDSLWRMQQIADDLRPQHCIFAKSEVFQKIYLLEFSYWTEGMPWEQYQILLNRYGFPSLGRKSNPKVIKKVERDIAELGITGLHIVGDMGLTRSIQFDGCTGCATCVEECQERALEARPSGHKLTIFINLALCNGIACRRCERVCPEKIFDLVRLVSSQGNKK